MSHLREIKTPFKKWDVGVPIGFV